MDKEKWIERTLFDSVKVKKGLCIKLLTAFFTGLPDRVVLMPGGKVYFVETKTKGDHPSPVQLYVHKLLVDLGFKIYVINTEEKLRSFLKML